MTRKAAYNTSQTDWERVDAMRDEDIDLSDIPEPTPGMFAKAVARRGMKPVSRKTQIALHLDTDVLE